MAKYRKTFYYCIWPLGYFETNVWFVASFALQLSKAEGLGTGCHQGVTRTCSEKIRYPTEDKRPIFNRRATMVKSSTVASSTPSQVKPSSKPISSATSSPHQIKQHAGSQQVSRPGQQASSQARPSQNQLRRKLSRKLELMPQLDGRAFPGTGVTNLLAGYQIERDLFGQLLFFNHISLEIFGRSCPQVSPGSQWP